MSNNTNKLAKIALNAKVDHPRMKGYYTGYDGIGRILPGTGGITYNFELGDNCMDIVGDHIEPGVTMANPQSAENKAVMTLSCIGNDVVILNGPASGAHGYVTGKHGGVNHVMAYFKPEDIEKMTGREDFLIKSIGQGMVQDNIEWTNLDPRLVDKIIDKDKKIKVTHVIPSALIGAGLGVSTILDGDIDLMTQDKEIVKELGLDSLRFGDIIAIEDLYCKHGPHHQRGALTIGVITHSDSFSSGHGPGITVIASTKDHDFDYELDDKANLKFIMDRV